MNGHRLPSALALALVALPLACGGPEVGSPDDDALSVATFALEPSDPLSAAVTSTCTTASVKALSIQLVEEIQCMRPGSVKSLEGEAGLALGDAVFPYLQAPAADALLAAQKARGTTMTINSALRTLPQQYLLYRWYRTGRCNIKLAAQPGRSNHESALAVDVADAQGWRPSMEAASMAWFGSRDPVHFDFAGRGALDLRGVSVLAFQRLWNRNHEDDRIAEDGIYGPQTEARLAKSPVGGFAKGPADCAPPDAPLPLPETPPPPIEVVASGAEVSGDADEGGCALAREPSAPAESAIFVAVVGACLGLLRAKRRESTR